MCISCFDLGQYMLCNIDPHIPVNCQTNIENRMHRTQNIVKRKISDDRASTKICDRKPPFSWPKGVNSWYMKSFTSGAFLWITSIDMMMMTTTNYPETTGKWRLHTKPFTPPPTPFPDPRGTKNKQNKTNNPSPPQKKHQKKTTNQAFQPPPPKKYFFGLAEIPGWGVLPMRGRWLSRSLRLTNPLWAASLERRHRGQPGWRSNVFVFFW